jgi:hypothetical protein
MRLAGVLGVLLFAVSPVVGSPVLYTFNTTTGSVMMNIAGQMSSASPLAGSFAVTIYQSDCHVGASDTFVLENAGLSNTTTMKLSLAGLATAALYPQSARFLDFGNTDFGPTPPVHIEPGGTQVVPTDVYVEATVFVTGLTTTTFSTKTWAGSLLPFSMSFNTSAMRSDVLTGLLAGTFGYEIGISDISLTITLDLVVNVEGTAHVVPDPALGGLTALGLGGAGAWLRRRRG